MPVSFDSISNLSPEFQKAFQMSVNADRKPIDQLQGRKEKILKKTELLEDLSGKIDGIRKLIPSMNTGVAIRELALNSDDPKVITGTADKSIADLGKHPIEVLQLAGSASALTNGFTDKNETRIGTGYLVFENFNGNSKEVFIDYENSTLEGIADAVNRANTGMKATVINDQTDPEAPYKLMFYHAGTGKTQDVSYPEFYFAGGEEDFYLDSERDAQNAIIKYQGYQIEVPSNELNDLIPGATLNLKGITEPGKPTTVSIEQDVPKTILKVKDLVDRLNQTFTFLQSNQVQVNDKKPSEKPLAGEYSIRLTENRLRESLRENFLFEEDSSRTIRSLQDLGITFQKNGQLGFDEKKLEHSLAANFDETVDLLAGDGETYGVITRLSRALTSISGSGIGLVQNQKETLNNQIRALDKQIESKEKMAEHRAENLKNQLAKAQGALSAMQGQAAYLGAQGGGGPAPTPGGL